MIHRLLFAGILVLGAVLRLRGLGDESLWHDESWTWFLVRDSLGDLFERLIHQDAHPPLYFLLLHPWVKLAGDSELLLRLPSALLGIASLPLLYRLGRSLAGPREGLFAMALLAVAPFHVLYSQEARSYALLFFLCLLSLDLGAALHREPASGSRWIALAAVTAAIVYTEYLGVFFLLGELALAAAWARGDRPFARRGLAAGAAALLLYLPWVPIAYGHVTQVGRGFWLPRPVPAVLAMEFSRMLVYPHGITAAMESAGSLAGAIGVALAAGPAVGIAVLGLGAARFTRRAELRPWVWATLLPGLSMAGAGFFISIFCARGLIYLLGPLFGLAAAATFQLPAVLRRGTIALALLSAVPGLLSLQRSLHKEDWRAAAGFLRERARPGDLIVVDEGFLDVNLQYYWRDRAGVEIRRVDEKASDPVPDLARGRTCVWLVRRAYPERTEPPGVLKGTFLERFWHVRETWRPRGEVEARLSPEFPGHEEWRWRDVGILRLSR